LAYINVWYFRLYPIKLTDKGPDVPKQAEDALKVEGEFQKQRTELILTSVTLTSIFMEEEQAVRGCMLG
jgi:hypothetical protein